jgi:hypothetical protein
VNFFSTVNKLGAQQIKCGKDFERCSPLVAAANPFAQNGQSSSPSTRETIAWSSAPKGKGCDRGCTCGIEAGDTTVSGGGAIQYEVQLLQASEVRLVLCRRDCVVLLVIDEVIVHAEGIVCLLSVKPLLGEGGHGVDVVACCVGVGVDFNDRDRRTAHKLKGLMVQQLKNY